MPRDRGEKGREKERDRQNERKSGAERRDEIRQEREKMMGGREACFE